MQTFFQDILYITYCICKVNESIIRENFEIFYGTIFGRFLHKVCMKKTWQYITETAFYNNYDNNYNFSSLQLEQVCLWCRLTGLLYTVKNL